jgi:hypothetical protein
LTRGAIDLKLVMAAMAAVRAFVDPMEVNS